MKLGTFLRETKSEMKHVVWPSRTRAAVYAITVIVFSLALGYFLYGFDTVFRVALAKILF